MLLDRLKMVRAHPPDIVQRRETTPDDSGTTVTDGCECDDEQLSEGEIVDIGTPTVCCKAHLRFQISLGAVLGTYTLYHLTDDTWSTFHNSASLDNPVEITCQYGTDEYDIVLDAAAKTITLEARAALNCDEVCFEYERTLDFGCQKASQFNLVRFSGVEDLDLPVCVCVMPVPYTPEQTEAPEACHNCIDWAADEVADQALISVSDVGTGGCGCGRCGAFSGTWRAFLSTCGTAGCCRWIATRRSDYDTCSGTWTGDCSCISFVTADPAIQLFVQTVKSGDNTLVTVTAWVLGCGSLPLASWSKTIDEAESCNGSHELALDVSSVCDCDGADLCNWPATITVRFTATTLPKPDDSGHCTACGA